MGAKSNMPSTTAQTDANLSHDTILYMK